MGTGLREVPQGFTHGWGLKRILILLLYLVGIAALVVLLVKVPYENVTSAFFHCAIIMTILYVTEVIPLQVTAMLPLMLDASDAAPSVSIQPNCFSMPLLQLLPAAIMVTSMQCTSLYPRCAHRLLWCVGTRARPLLVSMSGLSFLAAFIFEPLAAVLLLLALSNSAVAVLKMKNVQCIHRRALLESATQTMHPKLRRNIEAFIIREECELPSESSQELLPVSETTGQGADSRGKSATVEAKEATTPSCLRQSSRVSFLGNAEDTISVHSDAWRKSRRISFIQADRVVQPGESSPAPKIRSPRKRTTPQPCAEFLEEIVGENVQLVDIVNWHSSRYLIIQRNVMYGVMLLNVVASMLDTSGNPSNAYFLEYSRRAFHKTEVHQGNWSIVALPVAMCTLAFAARYLDHQFLSLFDAEQDDASVIAIRDIISDAEQGLGKLKASEIVPFLCFVIWLIRASNIFILRFKRNPQALLVIDYGLVVLLVLLPAKVNKVNAWTMRDLLKKLPWGALFLAGGFLLVKTAWKFVVTDGKLEQYIRKRMYGASPMTAQLMLIFTSAIITEFVSSLSTVSFLLPIARDLAESIRCHPLYLELPLTLAASTTLILPTSCLALAIIHDNTGIGPSQTVLPGLVIKAATVLAILVSANTFGSYVFRWDHSVESDASSTNSTSKVGLGLGELQD